MPQAIATAWDVFKSDLSDFDKRATLIKFDEVLGLGLAELHEAEEAAPPEIVQLAKERDEARAAKKWKKADELRKKIEDLGWRVVDESDASLLKRKE
jgi:cysteinyl-tRNA synthetase